MGITRYSNISNWKDTGYHIGGSDASGIVWAVGDNVKRWKVGDEVIIHCNRDDGDDEECNGGTNVFKISEEFGVMKLMTDLLLSLQLFNPATSKKPAHLSWRKWLLHFT